MKNLMTATLVFAAIQLTSAQSPFTGTWEGTLRAGTELRTYFRIVQDDPRNFSARLDVPGQGLKDIKVGHVAVTGDSISLTIPQFQASYAGR